MPLTAPVLSAHPNRSNARLPLHAVMLALVASLALPTSAPLAQSAGLETARPKSADGAVVGAAAPALSLSATLSENGPVIEQGMSWFVFKAEPGSDGNRTLVTRSKEAAPRFNLPPGDYIVTAAFGRATLTRRLTVVAGAPAVEKFNLDAGGLRIKAVLPNGAPVPDKSVVFDVLNEERDRQGDRIKVITGARPGLILRLNAGIYQVVSTYGDANAKVRAEVTVYPGKLTEASLSQTGAKVTFKLVPREGGEALADVTWSIINTKAEVVKETAGAVPTHILAAGRYAVLATHHGKTFRVEFTAKPGDQTIVEVVAR